MPAPDWRHLPSLSSLRAFEAASRYGNFSAAARALNVTHAAVSQAVRGLEAELGTMLLRRDGRGLALTEEGDRLARALRDGFGTIAAGIEALRGSEKGRGLRVTATPNFAQSVLLPRLGSFWRHHPDVAVSISPDYAIVDLARDGFDIAIRTGQGQWPGTAVEPVVRTRFILVGAPELVGRDGDLTRLPWLLSSGDPEEPHWLKAAGIDPGALMVNGIDNPILALSAALAGYGLLFSTDVVVTADLAAGRLVEVPFPGLPELTYWAVTLPGPRRPAVEAFVGWLRAQFPE
jgi:LysR family transcriptional regulator, glycine cleavage system transcriptional activator